MSNISTNGKVKASSTERIFSAAGVTIAAGGAFAVAWFNPSTENFFPKCPLLDLTGFACPGCGLTRGYHALFHGDILTALDFNALIPLYSIFFFYLLSSMFLIAVRGYGLPIKRLPEKAIWSFLFIGLGFAVLRNLPYYPFSVLYP